MRRLPILLLLACLLPLGAAELARDDLIGRWELDPAAATDAQADAVATASAVEGYGLTLTSRIGRALFETDAMVAGMWRIEDATDTGATLVIQSKGGGEHRYTLSRKGDHLFVTEAGGLPLRRP